MDFLGIGRAIGAASSVYNNERNIVAQGERQDKEHDFQARSWQENNNVQRELTQINTRSLEFINERNLAFEQERLDYQVVADQRRDYISLLRSIADLESREKLQNSRQEFETRNIDKGFHISKALSLLNLKGQIGLSVLNFGLQLYQQKSRQDFEKQHLERQAELQEIERQFRYDLQQAQLVLQLEMQKNLFEHEKDKIRDQAFITSYFRRKEQFGGSLILPGAWRENICPNDVEPIVIFDTVLRQDHKTQDNFFRFNPLSSLAARFKEQNELNGNYATIIESHEGFSSESDARVFYNCEFPLASAVIVYGDFLGNSLNIHAVYGGMTSDQFMIDAAGYVCVKPMSPKHSKLCSISRDTINEIFLQNQSVKDTFKKNDIEELIFDMSANVLLQLLIDNRFAFYPELPFIPKAENFLKKTQEDLLKKGITSLPVEFLNTVNKNFKLINEQRKKIEQYRKNFLIDSFNDIYIR